MAIRPISHYIDQPSAALIPSLISVYSRTTAPGSVLGTTTVDASLIGQPSFANLWQIMVDGPAAGQGRQIAIHTLASGTLMVAAPWTDSTGAAVQIPANTAYIISPIAPGGAGPAAPSIGLWMFGVCDPGMAGSLNTIVCPNLAGFPNDIFNNEFWMQVIHNANAPGTAPEREIRRITDFVGASGTFTTDAFSANVEANDLVAIFHESIMGMEIAGFGTLTTSSTTVPADAGRAAAYAWENNDYHKGFLLMLTEGNCRFQARRIVGYTAATGVFTLDPNNPFSQAPGLVDYVILRDQTEFVPAVDSASNIIPADVIGQKGDTIPAMNLAPGTDSLVRHLKAILERLGATPADPDDSALTNLGQRDDAATLDDLSDVTTTSIQAKLRRILLRMSTNAFTATTQGNVRVELDLMLADLATYFSALGAAYSAAVNPGGAARTNIEQTLEDLGDMLAGATGIVTFPAAAAPANGVSIAEVLRQVYNDVIALAGAGILHEQADVAVNITAIAAAETDVLNLAAANTRYVVRSLRLKCADPGANTVTVRLYELVNDVLTQVDSFDITTANFATYHSLMDMVGLPYLAGDRLQVTVRASAGGPYAVTGQYSYTTAT